MEQVQTFTERVLANVRKVIVGKDEQIRLTILALLCEGHVLIEDVPGVGKTMLARSIARSIGCSFSRVQFTPDMLPSDVTGVSIFNQKNLEFEFRPGPVMAQIVLTDEINRATPKTQSALLEAMEEGQITVDTHTYDLPRPFTVLATQNPIEYEGTFPLPEAQVDRFMLRIQLGYPVKRQEMEIMVLQQEAHPIDSLEQVATLEELLTAQRALTDIYVNDLVRAYVVDIVRATREHPDIYLGASPRGSLALFKTARAWAALEGRDFVTPDDIKTLAGPVLAHRLIASPSARIRGVDAASIVSEILGTTAVPGTDAAVA
jgi:MoxR-like ATPase